MNFFIGITLTIVVAILALRFVYKFLSSFKFQIDSEKSLNKLKNSGSAPDHVLDGLVRVAFDDKNKKIIFINGKKLLEYKYDDISNWRWEWIDYNGARKENKIVFYIRDPHRPMLEIEGLNAQTAEHWHAKIENILRA